MGELLNALADLLLGATCPGCDEPGISLCPSCQEKLQPSASFVTREDLALPIAAAHNYRPILNRIIPRYKEEGALHLDGLLGRLLAEAIDLISYPTNCLLVPVPSSPRTNRVRGFDHCARIANQAARITSLRSASLLQRSAHTAIQHTLSKQQRKLNLVDGLRARPTSAPVILVDDVVTTGSSLASAVEVLASAGVQIIGLAVVANADQICQPS